MALTELERFSLALARLEQLEHKSTEIRLTRGQLIRTVQAFQRLERCKCGVISER